MTPDLPLPEFADIEAAETTAEDLTAWGLPTVLLVEIGTKGAREQRRQGLGHQDLTARHIDHVARHVNSITRGMAS